MTRSTILLLVSLTVLLAACAPAAVGSGPRNPLRLGSGTLEVNPGSTAWLSGNYLLSELGLTNEDLEGAFWIPDGTNQQSARADGIVGLEINRIPALWQAVLAEARFVQGSDGRVTLRVQLKVTVPEQAQLGPQLIRAQLSARHGGTKNLEIPLRVRLAAR